MTIQDTYTLTTIPEKCPICEAAVETRDEYMADGHSVVAIEFNCGMVIEHNPRTDGAGRMSLDTPCDGYEG